ncbi:hypothetical protein AAVH_08244 [Aphelenchoides avenae]|nr:hypothetical protein AAVH_08244 [Aphelenchus avenae]
MRFSRSTLDKQPSTDNDGDDPKYVGSEDEDEDEDEDEEAPSKAGSEELFKRPSYVKGGKKRRMARDEVEQELLSIIRAPDDDDDEALCGRQVTNFL